jgi:HK97 family phage prohead protease
MAKKYEKKYLEFKYTMGEGDAEAGTFTGYLSVYDVVDSYGDVVKRGAFKKSIKDKKEFPILWSHDIFEPIGIFAAVEDEKGLLVTGKLNLDVQRGREIRSLMAQGAVKGLSIGYRVIDSKPAEREGVLVRLLKEIDLWEGSPCVFQACPDAEVDEVKSLIHRLGHDIDAIDRVDITPEVRAKLAEYIESMTALHDKAEPPAGTPLEDLDAEPPTDSDEATRCAAKDLRDTIAGLI